MEDWTIRPSSEVISDLQRELAAAKAENARLSKIAGDALGFSSYQIDGDTVEVLARAFSVLKEDFANALAARDDAIKQLKEALK